MKRNLFRVIIWALTCVCVCAMLAACVFIPNGNNDEDNELNSPTDITFEAITKDSIKVLDVLYGEEGGGETEISINGTDWKDFDNSVGYVFDGLTPNTEYTVCARQKGYGEYQASKSFCKKVKTLRVASDRVPTDVTATIYHGEVTLKGVTDEMEVSFDNGATYGANKTHTYTEKGEKTVLVRYKETSENLAGDDLKIKISYNDFAGGTGSSDDPFLIETYDELKAISDYDYKAAYKLLEDITFPAAPVCDIIVFSGTLLGNGKKLISPVIDYSDNNGINAYGGIFHTNGQDTVIRDLTVENAQITTAPSPMTHGILINSAKELSNCKVSGKIVLSCILSRSYSVGGLCGEIDDADSKISGCSADVTIELVGKETTGFYFGGLVGKVSANCVIENSNAKISAVNGSMVFMKGYAGGLVGAVKKATAVTIARSWAATSLTVSAMNCYAGGIIGLAPNTDITDCYATGSISVSGNYVNSQALCVAGGITAGVTQSIGAPSGSIANCYSAVDFNIQWNNSNVIVAGIICNALGTDKKLENCLYVGTATVSGDKTDNAKMYALTMQAAGYAVANNYIAAVSAEGMVDDDVITVAADVYLTAAWFKQTLKLDDTVWNLTDGKLPELIAAK